MKKLSCIERSFLMAMHLLYFDRKLFNNEIITCIHKFSIVLRRDIDSNLYLINLRHGFGMQLAVCTELPRHGSPPFLGGGLLHIRFLIILPLPQVVLHLP